MGCDEVSGTDLAFENTNSYYVKRSFQERREDLKA